MPLRQAQEQTFLDRRVLDRFGQAMASLPPEKAMVELAAVVRNLIAAPDLRLDQRAAPLLRVDELAQKPARACIERYLRDEHNLAREADGVWDAARDFWADLINAYDELLTQIEDGHDTCARLTLAHLAVRTLRAGVQLLKWDAFRHDPAAENLWPTLNRAHRLALRAGVAAQALQPRADRPTQTSVEREYLRAMALYSTGLDQLDSVRVVLVARLVHYVLPQLEIAQAPSTVSIYWVDLDAGLPPSRMLSTRAQGKTPRFFSGVAAAMVLESLIDQTSSTKQAFGLSLQLGADHEPPMLRAALSHLIRIWSGSASIRRERRHALMGSMMVVNGVAPLMRQLERSVAATAESYWAIRDASVSGVALEISGERLDGVEVGRLLGMHSTDGDRWRVGAVRRLWRGPMGAAMVGVELLGGVPTGVLADDGAVATRVLLLDPLTQGLPVRVVVAVPGLRHNVPLFLKSGGTTLKLAPMSSIEYGADFELRQYLCLP